MATKDEVNRKVAQACRLRAEGKSYQMIADDIGCSLAMAYRYVERGMIATIREPAEIVRRAEVERLDRLLRKALDILDKDHVMVSQGRVVREIIGYDEEAERPIYGDPIIDDAPTLNAIQTILKLMERRAKLLGLDAPAKMEVFTMDAITRRIDELKEQLGKNDDHVVPGLPVEE